MRKLAVLFSFVALLSTACSSGRDDVQRASRASPTTSRAEFLETPLLSGGVYACPFGSGYKAFAGPPRYFPPGHPGVPGPAVRPARCFTSAAAAQRAGYRLAATPAGVELVKGIYLVPAPAGLRDQCQVAARRLGFGVPCPRLVPSSPNEIECSTSPVQEDGCGSPGWFVLDLGGFTVPDDYVGVQGRDEAHGLIAAQPGGLGDEILGCPEPTERTTAMFGAVSGQVVHCPPGAVLHGGHVAAIWATHGVLCALSLHGFTDVNTALVRELATNTEFVA